ncbi:MAG: hypothetical protein EXX96DRAFT_550979 [Benjaminiella poitrasii]|nr:MAG: hypothetical protein EXX96DRAFT_550979 [Benjaminiella poitrasii]
MIQFWDLVKGKMKRHCLIKEDTLSSRIGEAYNDVHISDLYNFCDQSKRQIIKCYKQFQF